MYRILLYVICIKSINKHIDTKSKKFNKVLHVHIVIKTHYKGLIIFRMDLAYSQASLQHANFILDAFIACFAQFTI